MEVEIYEKNRNPDGKCKRPSTTVMAEKVLIEADVSRKKRKQVIDKQAAVIIMQSYLDGLAFQKK